MQIDTEGIELEDVAQDRITGFVGTVVAVTQWIAGCARITLQPKVDDKGKVPDSQSFDSLSLTVITPGPRHDQSDRQPVTATGGPRPEPDRGR
jgi:hypothetical protein